MRLAGVRRHGEGHVARPQLAFESQRLEFHGLYHRQNRPDVYNSADRVGNNFWAYNLFHLLMLK